jgi:hypothetical protein
MLERMNFRFTLFQKEEMGLVPLSRTEIVILVKVAQALQEAAKAELVPTEAASVRNTKALARLTRMISIDEAAEMIIDKYPSDEQIQIAQVLSQVERLGGLVDRYQEKIERKIA